MFCSKKKSPSSERSPFTSQHIVAIIHLCLVFTLIASSSGYPFMGELFAIKSHKSLYELVMGKDNPSNAERYSQLPKEEREMIDHRYHSLQKRTHGSFAEKFSRSMKILVSFLPPFKKAWIAFSLLIPIFVLLCIEGAAQTAWLLPLIVVAYALGNSGIGPKSLESQELFPKEEYIVQHYLKDPLSSKISQQQEQLLKGWQLYLIHEWADAVPSDDPLVFSRQVEKGNFFFDLARVKALSPLPHDRITFRRKPPLLVLMIYFLWNVFFAWFMNRAKRKPIRNFQKPISVKM